MEIKGIIYLVKRFRVPSKSEKGNYHLVELYSDNSLECDCLANLFRKGKCRHIDIVRNYLSQQKYESEIQKK